ncbi:hypothetical protein [Actinomadura livida]|nr:MULTISPECIES: hypothetical protein [Actinomadura]MBB4772076.1 hypothetical protein [Actinomadura catellatispora]
MESVDEFLGRQRYVAVDDDLHWRFHSPIAPLQLRAPAADVERWLDATGTLVERVMEVNRQDHRAAVRLKPALTPMWRRILWKIRPKASRARMRSEYEAVHDRLYGELAQAYEAYDEQTTGLVERVQAKHLAAQRETEALVRQELREREERIATLGGPEDAVWAYCVLEKPDGQRDIEIWVPALDDDPPAPPLLANVTAREIQAEIARERDERPYTAVFWSLNTSEAMRERQGDENPYHEDYEDEAEARTWEELTGERIEQLPTPPDTGHGSGPTGTHGPSSTYGSDYGAGGDYGGGGYTGGFGGSF